MYKLDRTAFQMGKANEAALKQTQYWKSKSPEDRLSAALFLIAQVYGYLDEGFPDMDRTKFSMRKR